MASSSSATDYNKAARLEALLSTLLQDPLLSDVPKNVNLADIDTLISVELGSAMKISVLKMDNTSIDVAVPNNARVQDLKKIIQKKFAGLQQVDMGYRHISWRHVWKNFALCYTNQKLLDDSALLQSYGIRNNCQIRFVSYITSREQGKHSRAKKRRFFHGLSKQV